MIKDYSANFKTLQEITQTVQKMCDLLHCVKMRLVLSANENARLQCEINSANHGSGRTLHSAVCK